MTLLSRRGIVGRAVLALSLGALTLTLVAPVADAASPKTKRVSIKSNGAEADANSRRADITPDGRFVVFESKSDVLAGNDTNGLDDVDLRDMQKKKTRLLSVNSKGTVGDLKSGEPVISANGRYVAFETYATNMFNDGPEDVVDIAIRDRKKGKVRLVSKGSRGAKGNDDSFDPDISQDGRYIVFASHATTLVSGDTKGKPQIYIHDSVKKTTKLVSKSSSGKRGDDDSWAPSVSANGRFVAFSSEADNLVKNDNNGAADIFVHDRKKKRTTLVSLRSDGTDGGFGDDSTRPQISADGQLVAFASEAELAGSDVNGSVLDIYVHNRAKKKTKHVSVRGNGAGADALSRDPSISPDGRFVAFESEADNLVNGDDNGTFDIFIHDRKKGRTKRISVGVNGSEADGLSGNPSVSAGGRFVAFDSLATNLIGSDKTRKQDVFRRGPLR